MQYLGAFLLAFFPGFISVAVQNKIRKGEPERASRREFFLAWVCYTYVINVCMGLAKRISGWGGWLYSDTLNQANNVFSYGVLACILSVLLPVAWNWKYMSRRLVANRADSLPEETVQEPALAGNVLGKWDKVRFVALSFAVAAFTVFFWNQGNYKTYDFNMGTVAFSYQYGFICRSFIGTALEILAKLLGEEVSARLINQFNFLVAIALVLAVILFLYLVGTRTGKLSGAAAAKDVFIAGLVFEAGIGFSTFFVDWGRTDIFLLILSLLACWLLVVQKGTFLVVPIAVVCMLIHEGYIFMYANLLFVALAYRVVCCLEEKNKRAIVRYVVEFGVSMALVVVLFLYFYFIAKPKADLTYIQVLKNTLDVIGSPTNDLINTIYAIQGQLFGNRWTYAGSDTLAMRIHYLVPTIIAFSPFIAIFFSYWHIVYRNVRKGGSGKLRKIFYCLIPFGSVTVLPLFILHMDYWRWYYQICVYELFIVLTLIACGDELLTQSLRELFGRIAKVRWLPAALVVYAVILGPFRNEGFYICEYYQNGIDAIKQMF